MFWQLRLHIFGLCGAVLVSLRNSHLKLDLQTLLMLWGKLC